MGLIYPDALQLNVILGLLLVVSRYPPDLYLVTNTI